MSASVRHFLSRVAEYDNERISEAWEQLSEDEQREADELVASDATMEMPVPIMFRTLTF